MGRRNASNTIALQYDDEGKLRFDAIARVGHGKDKVCKITLFLL